MKLARVYSNDEATFPTITFHEGLNVIFARVQNPAQRDQDSHNLGKTFLIEIIDFALLKEVDAKHPLRRFPDCFGEFVFYLEVVTTRGQYVTVRRRVQGRPVCSIHVADAPHGPLLAAPDDTWTYPALSRTTGVETLNRLLGLAVPNGYDYRKGPRRAA